LLSNSSPSPLVTEANNKPLFSKTLWSPRSALGASLLGKCCNTALTRAPSKLSLTNSSLLTFISRNFAFGAFSIAIFKNSLDKLIPVTSKPFSENHAQTIQGPQPASKIFFPFKPFSKKFANGSSDLRVKRGLWDSHSLAVFS
jgi:hypothetical protein